MKAENNLFFIGVFFGIFLGFLIIGGIVMVNKSHIATWPMIDNVLADEVTVEVGAIYSKKLETFSDAITYIRILAVKEGDCQYMFVDRYGKPTGRLKFEQPVEWIKYWGKTRAVRG